MRFTNMQARLTPVRRAAQAWKNPGNPLGPQSSKWHPLKGVMSRLGSDIGLGASLFRTVFASLRKLLPFRREEGASAPPRDAEQLFQAWGVTEESLPAVLRGLRLQRASLIILVLLGAVLVARADGMARVWIPGGIMALASCFGIVVLTWRLRVLKARRYVSFQEWVTRKRSLREEG